jgi:PAS domain S-box-containing protein
MPAPLPPDEFRRLSALRDLGLLDTAPEPAFDLAVALIQQLAGVESALVSLVDENRQWFKAKAGLDVCETPRDAAFCAHAILQDDVLWIEDATADARFQDNPLVVGAPHIRFYAGAPLIVRGARIGSLCMFDPAPRPADPRLRALLETTARSLSQHIERRSDGLAATSLLDHSTDAAVTVNAEGHLTSWSAGAERMFGWSAEEALGRSLDIILPSDLAAAHWTGFFRYVGGGEPRLFGKPVELTARRRDGAHFPMELTLAHWDEAGRVSVGALIRDISLRKAVDQQLRQALLDAEASDRAKSRFLAAMNHEMRTPLNGVLGMGHILAASTLDPLQTQALDMILESGRHLETLLADIVTFSAEEDTPSAPFAPSEALGEALRQPLASAATKGLPVDILIAAHLPSQVSGYAESFGHIVRCLADNAVKFTRQGRVSVHLDWADDRMRLTISDTGEGFDIQRLDQLLKPFEQADNSITRRHDGAGVGLALVERCVRRSGGRLSAESTPGLGSTFTIDLPVGAVATQQTVTA